MTFKVMDDSLIADKGIKSLILAKHFADVEVIDGSTRCEIIDEDTDIVVATWDGEFDIAGDPTWKSND